MFQSSIKALLVGILVCVAVYVGVFIGRVNSRNVLYVPDIPERTVSENDGIIKININTATLDELQMLPVVGKTIAENIIRYREKYGKFVDIIEIRYVDGITKDLYEKIEKYLTIGGF